MPENTLIISFVKRMYKNKTKIKISKKNSYGFLSSDKIYKLNFALCRFSKYSASNSLWWYFATHKNDPTDFLPVICFFALIVLCFLAYYDITLFWSPKCLFTSLSTDVRIRSDLSKQYPLHTTCIPIWSTF